MTFAGSGRRGRFRLTGHVFRVAAVLASTCCLAGVAHAQAGSRPNIVLFYVDDLRHDGLGVTGHPFVETPNLDRRIAGQGVNFRNSFVNCPLCSPSRASLLTGQYAVTHGYTVNDDVNAVPDERLPIYQHALRGAGYRTGHVGKWHKDSYVEPRPGFDYWVTFHGQGVHTDPQLRVKQYDAPVRTVNETGFTTNVLTEYALDFLDDYGTGGTRTEPFALTLSFKAVHGPHGDQYTQSGGAYAGQTIDRPPNARPDYGGYSINEEKPVYSLPGLNGLTLNNTMGNSQQISQMEMMKDIDTNIGRVLDALEAKGLDDDTLVIFTSDNGFFWGEHGRGDKRLAYDESIRVPLLMRGPGVQGGRTSDALVTNIDLAPTILTAAGLPVPPSMQGQPLNGLLSGSGGFARDAVFAEYYPEVKQPGIQRWDAVRTETHLYVTHPLAGTQYDELYDMVEDPYQMNNLLLPGPADTLPDGTRQVLQQMQTRLVELRREANSVNPFTRQLISGDAVIDYSVTTSGVVRSDATAARVGSNTDIAGGGNGRSAVLAFELPTIDDPALLERAFVSFHIVQQTGNVSTVNADLWAIGITDENTRLAEHLGANTEVGLADRADNVKLQDNIISLGQGHLARTFSNDAAASVLAEYLRDFYEANPRYAGGRFLQVRLNPDRDLGATSVGWDISTMEAPTSSTDPRPFTFRQPALSMQFTAVPEPATLTWYGDGVHPGGDGTWTIAGNNWFDGTSVRSWVPGARAIFSGSAGTIALGPGVTVTGGLEFRSTGYTLAGAGLTLGGTAGGAVEVANGVTATIASALSGTAGLVKAGGGTLTLGAANTFTGTTSVNRGTLMVTNSGALAASPILVQTSGTLRLPSASRLVLSAKSLSVDQATGGTVDVGKGRITIAAGGTTEADLRADLLAGRSGGTWSGTSGIVTTGGTAGLSTQPVVGYRVFASGSAIVAWAALGDANLDGQVNLTDVSLINNEGEFGQGASTGATWVQGDFNYSGSVTLTDIALLNNSGLYGKGSYLPVAGLGSISGATPVVGVPEPGTVGLAIMGLVATAGVIRRGRRWGSSRG